MIIVTTPLNGVVFFCSFKNVCILLTAHILSARLHSRLTELKNCFMSVSMKISNRYYIYFFFRTSWSVMRQLEGSKEEEEE